MALNTQTSNFLIFGQIGPKNFYRPLHSSLASSSGVLEKRYVKINIDTDLAKSVYLINIGGHVGDWHIIYRVKKRGPEHFLADLCRQINTYLSDDVIFDNFT